MSALVFALCVASTAPRGLDDLGGSDKLLHAGAAATITAATWSAAAAVDAAMPMRLAAGVGVGVVAGLAKEAVDLGGFGTPSLGDLVYDGFGIALGVAVALVVETLVASPRRPAPSTIE